MAAVTEHAAHAYDARFRAWTRIGGISYNPYQRGDATEIMSRLLFDEVTEPYYLRVFQRHLQQIITALQAAGIVVSLRSVVHFSSAPKWNTLLDRLNGNAAERLASYVDTLSPQIIRDLAGSIARLAVLSESNFGKWLEPNPTAWHTIDLYEALERGDVVYFGLDADAQPEISKMLAAAIVLDLVTVMARRQTGEHPPALILIDEFSAIAPAETASLVARARSADISVLLATQELADIDSRVQGLLSKIVGNLSAIVAHRQVVPESREYLAKIAGTVPAWTLTAQIRSWFGATGLGSKARDREFRVHPDQFADLRVGQAFLLTPGSRPAARLIKVPSVIDVMKGRRRRAH